MSTIHTPLASIMFIIRFTATVTFRDLNGTVQKVYKTGDTCMASHDNGSYYVTPMGGVYHYEAVRIT